MNEADRRAAWLRCGARRSHTNLIASATMNIDWNLTLAAVWRPHKQYLRPVRHLAPVRLARHRQIIADQGAAERLSSARAAAHSGLQARSRQSARYRPCRPE